MTIRDPVEHKRRYGWSHQQLRRRWEATVARGEVLCARCGRLIVPGTPWHLDHRDGDPTSYLGPSHRRCNCATATHAAERRRGEGRRSLIW